MAFDPKNLKPANKQDASADTGKRDARADMLATIETQLALFAYPLARGDRHYEVEDGRVTFWLRYAGKSLTLLPGVTKVQVPQDQFVGALEHYRAELAKGTLDEQLTAFGAAGDSRKASAKATREAKKAAKPGA